MRYRRSIAKGSTYFFTLVTFERKKILSTDDNVAIIREAFAHVAKRRPFATEAAIIMPDHIHCIWTMPEGDADFSTRWRLIKSRFTRGFGRYGEYNNPSRVKKGERAVWQRRFWEHMIQNEKDFQNHVDYIHYNPVKHGLAKSPKDWPYSSFHRYVKDGIYPLDWGGKGDIELPPEIGRE